MLLFVKKLYALYLNRPDSRTVGNRLKLGLVNKQIKLQYYFPSLFFLVKFFFSFVEIINNFFSGCYFLQFIALLLLLLCLQYLISNFTASNKCQFFSILFSHKENVWCLRIFFSIQVHYLCSAKPVALNYTVQENEN